MKKRSLKDGREHAHDATVPVYHFETPRSFIGPLPYMVMHHVKSCKFLIT